MTADIRAAAQAETEATAHFGPPDFSAPNDRTIKWATYVHGFTEGAVWAQTRVTPTREQIAEVVRAHNLDELLLGGGGEWLWFTAACSCGWRSEQYEYPGDAHKIHAAHVAAHVSKLLAGLAEGEAK